MHLQLPVWMLAVLMGGLAVLCENATASGEGTTEFGAPGSGAARHEGVTGLDGRSVNPFAESTGRAVVFIFISIECPICNRYAPEIQRLQEKFSKEGAVFWLVQPNADEAPADTRRYLEEFGYRFGLLRDPKHALVKAAGVRVTPEAAVFDPGGKLVYHGRIDDRYADFGKARPAPVQRELHAVLEALLSERSIPVTNATAVGCFISR